MSYTLMHPGRVSVIIPGCNERFMAATMADLLAQARGDVEILAIVDGIGGEPGPAQDPPLPTDPRVRVILNPTQRNMRPSTNDAVKIATGEFIMKCDAHCRFGEGWDVLLAKDCADDWVSVPTRHSLDGATWEVRPRDFNYHYLTFPYSRSMYGYGIHGKTFDWRTNKRINAERAHTPIDDLMSFQGSCWFTTKANFLRLGPLDHAHYYFYSEAIEVGMRQWISGGRVVINKRTWYAHLHKGNNDLHTVNGRSGRGFFLSLQKKRESEAYATDYWMENRMPHARRTFAQFMDRFAHLLPYIPEAEHWPVDWQDARHRVDFLNRPESALPAHL